MKNTSGLVKGRGRFSFTCNPGKSEVNITAGVFITISRANQAGDISPAVTGVGVCR